MRWKWHATVIFAALALMACSDKKGEGDPDAGNGGGNKPDATTGQVELGDPCVSSDDCPGQFCDKRHGACVECYSDRHCADGRVCQYGSCVDEALCGDVNPCELGICDQGACVDCIEDADCADGLSCVDAICRPAFPECTEFADCSALGAVCGDEGSCVECTDDTQCGDYETCEDNSCMPKLCVAGAADCIGEAVRVCRGDGQGYSQILCGEGKTCFAGECIFDQCEPNTTQCDKWQLKQCTADGQLLTKACPIGQECQADECRPMKQRVLVVFDTSGSMNWYPGTQDAPTPCGAGETEGCLAPYPACEDLDNPLTTLGISKSVFGEFFKSEETQGVLFGLQRFPQIASDASPVCEGGYFSWDVEMTGDDQLIEPPLTQETWFDENLGEIILVPFPPTASETNVQDLTRWMDGLELTVKSDTECFGPKDCPKGVCTGVGALGTKTCRDFANPELRAIGGTPLGKSLFYAGEYMRRNVVIDGKPCSDDTDCGSPGYFCSEAGECFDPLRECRLNVIVLFTDGGETVHPFTDDFFNPQVQAKRLRYGLGCGTDADCSKLTFCDQAGSCYPTKCSLQGYCTNDVIEDDETDQIMMAMGGTADRLRDYRGNPISLIVNVVDGSLTDPQQSETTLNANRLIALYGGGQHIVVDVDDPPNFLAQLRRSVDFKELFEACAAQPSP